MAEYPKMFELEERPEEPFDILHINLWVPRQIVPQEARGHFKAAIREMLLAGRSLIDATIERAEEKPAKKRTKIEVE